MPTSAEVYWKLPEGRFVYWRGSVTSAALRKCSVIGWAVSKRDNEGIAYDVGAPE